MAGFSSAPLQMPKCWEIFGQGFQNGCIIDATTDHQLWQSGQGIFQHPIGYQEALLQRQAMSILATLLTEAQAKRGASDREVARQVNISPTTVGRIKKGESVDLATLEKVCAWIGVDPSAVLDTYAYSDESLGDQIQAILEVNPALYDAFKRSVNMIQAGQMSPDTLREIVNYINYRLSIEPQAKQE